MTNEQMAVMINKNKILHDHIINMVEGNLKEENISQEKIEKIIRPLFFYSKEMDDDIRVLTKNKE